LKTSSIESILSSDFLVSASLRPMTDKDLERVYRWRTDPRTLKRANDPSDFSFEEHLGWWENTPKLLKLVFEYGGKPAGVILYDNETRYWGFYLNPKNSSRKGLGRIMLSLFMPIAKSLKIKTIKATVKLDNYASRALHEILGFRTIHFSTFALEYQKEL